MKVDTSNVVRAQAAGYKIVNENGETLYCRKDPITGSRIAQKTICLTAREWREVDESVQRTLTEKLEASPVPPKPPGGGG